jgi:hypothetical protein
MQPAGSFFDKEKKMNELAREIPIPDFPDTKLLSRNSDGNVVTLWHRPESVPPLLYVTIYDTKTDQNTLSFRLRNQAQPWRGTSTHLRSLAMPQPEQVLNYSATPK